MTAEDTARRTLSWAMSDMTTAIPEGDLADAVGLAEPGRDALRLVGRLAAITSARLRLSAPLFGDRRPAGIGAVPLAAAVGGLRHGDRARLLLRAVRPAARAADLLAYHGVVAPVVGRFPDLGDRLRDVSPLTGVLDRPSTRTVAKCESLLDRLRADPAARAVLVARFARPPDTPEQARWRGECLAYTRHDDPDFVVEVYESAFLHYAQEHHAMVRTAWRHVLGRGGSAERVLPTATWWRALAELEAAAPHRTRGLGGLGGLDLRRDGTNLFRRTQAWETA